MATVNGDHPVEPGRHFGPAMDDAIALGEWQKQMLLVLAREAIASYLRDGTIPAFDTEDPRLREPSGVFVTLRAYEPPARTGDEAMVLPPQGRLRGCVGRIVADKPLYRAVQEMAARAAVHDPRFPPLELAELEHVRLEISILSPLHPVSSLEQVVMGQHGLVIEEGSYRGVLLPKVAPSMGWNRQQFLENLCRKAGLPRHAWPGKAALFAFTALDFAEPG